MNSAFNKLNDLIVELNEEYTCINRDSEPTFDGYNEARLDAIRALAKKIDSEALDLLTPDLSSECGFCEECGYPYSTTFDYSVHDCKPDPNLLQDVEPIDWELYDM